MGPREDSDTIDDEFNVELSQNEQLKVNKKLEISDETCGINDHYKEVRGGQDLNFVCKIALCDKSFQTFFGLERHKALKHSTAKVGKEESICILCDKKVIYLDQHMRAKHSAVQKPKQCEVCLLEVHSNMQKHRKTCITCRHCDYQNSIKARLLNHIKKCDKQFLNPYPESHNEEPLDLRSPMKVSKSNPDNTDNPEVGSDFIRREVVVNEAHKKALDEEDNPTPNNVSTENTIDPSEISQTASNNENEFLEKGRLKYPFDDRATEEDYYSEIDIDDTDVFTIERRRNKDVLELELREIDSLHNSEIEGDNIIVAKFEEFMRNKRSKNEKEGCFSKQTEPTTINAYSSVVRTDILKALHKLIKPFDARWLIDCKTTKVCTFEGEERLHVRPEEPIYLTSRILQEAMKRYEACGNSGNQKKKVIASFNQLMAFIELHFTLKLNAYGVDVLNRVLTYHQGVKSFINGTSQWKKNNDEEKEGFEKNKLINDYECPNKDVDVLEKYKEYVKSEERILKISKLLSFAHSDAQAPPPSQMTEFGINVMEEIVACTGCNPKLQGI